VLFFVIFGSRGITSTKGTGNFHCPECRQERGYRNRVVRRFFTLFFIPVIPLGEVGRYVECDACTGTFRPDVLSYDPSAEQRHVEAEFHGATKLVMIHMLLADGEVDDAEVDVIVDVLGTLTGRPADAALIREQIDSAAVRQRDPVSVAAELSPYLNTAGKEIVVRAAIRVAWADGHLDRREETLLERLGDALELSGAHLKGLMLEAAEQRAR
jgi:tellurite resistance protein